MNKNTTQQKKESKKERRKRRIANVRENIKNVPNALTLIRVILSFVLIFIVFKNASLITIAIVFAIAALTDGADGFIARRYNQITNFGRRFDVIADRLLMISIIVALLIYMILHDTLTQMKIILFLLIISREIFCAPALIIALVKKNSRPLPHARFAGKMMTFFQGITFPTIVIGWPVAFPLAVITFFNGLIAACYYWYDSLINPRNRFQVGLDKDYNKLLK